MDAKKTKSVLAIAVIIFIVVALVALLNPLQNVKWKLTDLFFRGRPVSDQIAIIAIDDKSLDPQAGLGRFRDWPRSYYAQLLRTLSALKPAIVAFDIDFREKSRGMSDLRLRQLLREYERRNATASGMTGGASLNWYGLLKEFELKEGGGATHPDDLDFQKAVDESGKVAFIASLVFYAEPKDIDKEFPAPANLIAPIFQGDNVLTGYSNAFRDRDGTLRRFMPAARTKEDGVLQKSLPLLLVENFLPDALPRLSSYETAQTSLLINYAAKPGSYKTISFVDALAGRIAPSDVEGKIVFIGATASILQDFQVTPASRIQMSGVEVLANIAQQMIEGKSLSQQGFAGLLFALLVFAFGGSILMLHLPLRFIGVLFAAVLFGFPALAFALYQGGIALNVVYPEMAWIFVGMAVLWYRNKTEIKAKQEIKKAFAHYVSPVIVEQLAKDSKNLVLGGKKQEITVLFSDIVGFTTLAEKLSPEDTVALLNDYLTAMTEVIFGFNGTLDKYQGDAIMALFGAPLDDPHHALNACHTALGMRRALGSLHEKWNAIAGLPFKEDLIRLDFRVGIATGQAVVGNVGSEKRFDYTAIGDIVNLGSRLEGLNKKYGTHIVVDKETFAAVTENHNPFTYRKLDTVCVKGKQHETEIFELLALAENTTSDMKIMLDDFENGRIMYMQRNFMEAKQYFEAALTKVSADAPSQIYRNRCNFFLRKPPGRDWSPVVNLEEK